MVYFRLTTGLLSIIEASGLQNLVGCQRYCDRQIISFNQLDQVLQKLKKDFKDTKDKLDKKTLKDSKKKEVKDEIMKKHFDIMEFVNKDIGSNETLEEIQK